MYMQSCYLGLLDKYCYALIIDTNDDSVNIDKTCNDKNEQLCHTSKVPE